jgi:hypothetical protein
MHNSQFKRHAPAILALIALAGPVFAAQPARITRTPVALVSVAPDVTPLQRCIAENVAATGPVLSPEQFVEGLEFRIGLLGDTSAQAAVTITALLKPNPSTLMESHDGDAEAQPAATARLYGLLRIHVGTRAWLWQSDRTREICREAAAWITRLRAKPILFDHIGADGEPR